MMWSALTSAVSMQWWWLIVGVALMAGILLLHDLRLQPRTGVALTVIALLLVVCWIAVARELNA